MRIDYDKLILLLLPIRLRTVRLFSLLQVMVSPIKRLHDEFHAYADLRRLRASATPQALMIEQIVLAETGVSIQILPITDSISPDFEVKHPSDASASDVLAARSVVDRYKLAGKTYRVIGSVIPFSHEWSDYVCAVNAYTSVVLVIDYIKDAFTNKLDVNINSPVPTASEVTIILRVTSSNGKDENMTFIIPNGGTTSGIVHSVETGFASVNFEVISITSTTTGLSHDDTYLYSLNP